MLQSAYCVPAAGIVAFMSRSYIPDVVTVISNLAAHQFDARWGRYWRESPFADVGQELMDAVFAYAVSGEAVRRTQYLVNQGGHRVTVQQLESDGMVQLVPAGV